MKGFNKRKERKGVESLQRKKSLKRTRKSDSVSLPKKEVNDLKQSRECEPK